MYMKFFEIISKDITLLTGSEIITLILILIQTMLLIALVWMIINMIVEFIKNKSLFKDIIKAIISISKLTTAPLNKPKSNSERHHRQFFEGKNIAIKCSPCTARKFIGDVRKYNPDIEICGLSQYMLANDKTIYFIYSFYENIPSTMYFFSSGHNIGRKLYDWTKVNGKKKKYR